MFGTWEKETKHKDARKWDEWYFNHLRNSSSRIVEKLLKVTFFTHVHEVSRLEISIIIFSVILVLDPIILCHPHEHFSMIMEPIWNTNALGYKFPPTPNIPWHCPAAIEGLGSEFSKGVNPSPAQLVKLQAIKTINPGTLLPFSYYLQHPEKSLAYSHVSKGFLDKLYINRY